MHFADPKPAEPHSMFAHYTLTAPPSLIAELFVDDVELGISPLQYGVNCPQPSEDVDSFEADKPQFIRRH
jgi:hypothetical protein